MTPTLDAPASQRYAFFKAQYPGVILAFRIGDEYQLLKDDAIDANRILGTTVGALSTGEPMVRIPAPNFEARLRSLIYARRRVAVIEPAA